MDRNQVPSRNLVSAGPTHNIKWNGVVVSQRVKVDYWWKGELTIIENVPAGVCQQCGEEHYDGKVAEEMEQIVKLKESVRTIPVPVKEYKEVSAVA